MAATVEYYEQLVEEFSNPESLTVLVVSGATRNAVAEELGVNLGARADRSWSEDGSTTAWALLDVPGGVVAVEHTGYGDPTPAALAAVSANGAAAVVRHNIQGHLRFGCARNGRLLFDHDEYTYIEDTARVPAELRPLFDLAWDDLDSDNDDDLADGLVVAFAMAERITGIELTADLIAEVAQQPIFSGPSLVYADSLED